MEIVDANIVLRFIMDDNIEMADKAAEILENRKVYILEEVLAEIVYVMEKVYRIERIEISEVLIKFLKYENIFIDNQDVMLEALNIFYKEKLDFVDSILYGYAKCRNAVIHTFDKKLNKNINRI